MVICFDRVKPDRSISVMETGKIFSNYINDYSYQPNINYIKPTCTRRKSRDGYTVDLVRRCRRSRAERNSIANGPD